MSETVKLIIEMPKATYEDLKSGKIYSSLCEAPQGLVEGIRNGIPLDSNDSDRAEVQAYFAGQTYGWEEGRKALIEDLKAEINEERVFARDDFRQYKVDILGVDPETVDDEYPNDEFYEGMKRVIDIINEHIGKAESENHEEEEKRKIDFLEFLVNHINPNDMEKYRTMYESEGNPTEGSEK